MFGCVDSCVLAGLDVRRVRVEADISRGSQVEFSLVGLASTTVKEARARVRSAVRNSGLEFPTTRLTVNLAPAELRKEGTALDLPIAIAIVLARAERPAPARSAFLGELALDGSVRHVDGVLVAARGLRELGYETIFVPADDAIEATLAGDLEVIPCESLIAVVKHLLESEPIPVAAPHCGGGASECPIDHDLVEVHGQEEAKRALEVAAGADIISCSAARPAPARRCSRAASRGSCRRSSLVRLSTWPRSAASSASCRATGRWTGRARFVPRITACPPPASSAVGGGWRYRARSAGPTMESFSWTSWRSSRLRSSRHSANPSSPAGSRSPAPAARSLTPRASPSSRRPIHVRAVGRVTARGRAGAHPARSTPITADYRRRLPAGSTSRSPCAGCHTTPSLRNLEASRRRRCETGSSPPASASSRGRAA